MVAEGDLAESYEPNATADLWTFTLRKGVEWHNGKPLRAADVMYTVQRILDPATASPMRQTLDPVDLSNSKADGDLVVQFKLKAPNADFPVLFNDFHAQIVPQGMTQFDHAVGTGPFRLKELEPGVRAVTERNPNYFRSDRPYLDSVETITVADPVARLNALLAGEVHLLEHVEPGSIERVRSTEGIQLLSSKSGRHTVFSMNTQAAPYNNKDVRNALKYCFDREKFVQIVLKGEGQVANDQPIPPQDPWFCTDLAQRQYDPDKAKSLLKKAGADGMRFDLSTSSIDSAMMDGALAFQQMAAKAGVNVNIIQEPADSYWDVVWLKKSFVTSQWNQRPVPDMMFSIGYVTGSAWNETHWADAQFDKLVAQARGELNMAKRKELYCACQRLINDEGGEAIPAFQNILDAGSNKVGGMALSPLGPLGFWQTEGLWLRA
jgi:peptide/nickel transport system substrate-binding protein